MVKGPESEVLIKKCLYSKTCVATLTVLRLYLDETGVTPLTLSRNIVRERIRAMP